MSIITEKEYAALEETDKQYIFDFVVKHLLEQGVRAVKDGFCRYRGTNGTACAVGCMIPEKLYDTVLESLFVTELGDTLAGKIDLELYDLILKNEKLFSDLQEFHDYTFTLKPKLEQYNTLVNIANMHGLIFNYTIAQMIELD